MKALQRKLLRDLRLMWSQALTIALVVASGVAGFVTTLSAVDSLVQAREDFYARSRFADVFAAVRRAPLSLAGELRSLPGVVDVQDTLEQVVRVEIEGVDDPMLGQLIGVDRRRPPRINLLTLRGGQGLPEIASSDGALPVLVSPGFAQARSLGPGSRLQALVNGRRRVLQVQGVALSPEYVFAGLAGTPDQRGFGVFWVDRDALASAYDMGGAFNRVAVKLAPWVSERDVVERLRERLAPYGAADVHGRDDQPSHAMLDNEIREQIVMGSVLPSIFLAVAAFLLHVVVSRLVATQREQIAALKALGYPDRAIAAHYLQWMLCIVAAGAVLGVWAGREMGAVLADLYAEFFFFPDFAHVLEPSRAAVAVGIALLTGTLGTLSALGTVVRLAPAEAMRPLAPARYRPTLVERLGVAGLGAPTRMILRQLERRPLRALASIGGVAASVAIVVLGNFFDDAIDAVMDSQFEVALRGDVILWTVDPVPAVTAAEVLRLPGAVSVEAGRQVPVRLGHGHRSERVALQGWASPAALRRIVDVDNRQTPPEGGGLVLTDRLADKLGVVPGSAIRVEVLEGRRQVLWLPVQATVREMMGLNAYMERRALNRALGDDDLASQFTVAVERGREAALLEATRGLPRVAGSFSKSTLQRNLQEISARNVRVMSTILTAFAVVIAVGVVYNNARIALAERQWELASLRVLGFTRGEVSALLLGELALIIVVALPLGMAMGDGLVRLIIGLLSTDQFHFPVAISPRTFAWSALCVLAAGGASAMVVRRRIDTLDLVAALKTRE